jgi:ABC-type antimicrobial peptide transport system permease subunit
MASSTSQPSLTQQRSLFMLPAITKIAGWRFKQMWRFLLVTWMGMLAMVVLICAGPLLARVANGASLRGLLENAPDGPYITLDAISSHPTQAQLQQIEQQANQVLQHGTLGSYLHAAPQLIIQTPSLDIISNSRVTYPSAFHLAGYDMTQASQHAEVIQGRLPQATTDGTVEIALSQDAATALGLQVGSTIEGRYPIALGSPVWNLQVVGIIAPKATSDPFWAMADPFSKATVALNSRYYRVQEGASSYTVLAANDAIQPKIAVLQSTSTEGAGTIINNTVTLFVFFLRYPFDLTHFNVNDMPALAQQTTDIDLRFSDGLVSSVSDLRGADVFGTVFTGLENSSSYIRIVQTETTVLLLITLALVLFLVSMMSDLLIERQAAIIATLRSRGASKRHIFGAFTIQGMVLALAALLIGPFLAILLVEFIAQSLLTPDYSAALIAITAQPLQVALDVKWYALIAVAAALFFMVLAINKATKMDIVAMRRAASRAQRAPLWRRLNLDLFFSFLLLIGFVAFAYFWPAINTSGGQIDPDVFVLLTNLGSFATPLLAAAILFLFLRIFPYILRLATTLTAKMRSASPILALAQMERRPRPAARIIILLALAIASSSFLLTLIATKDQYNVATANFFAEGADFSGSLPTSNSSSTFAQLQAQYSNLSGVQSATLGYQDVVQLSADQSTQGQGSLTIDAVDTNTYAHTINWSTAYTSRPLSDLMAQLKAHQADATSRHVVYALVDAATWQRLHLSSGEQFSLPLDGDGLVHANFIALAPISYVPGVKDLSALAWSGMGIIVDYQSYITVKALITGEAVSTFAPNYIWLRTNNNAASLAHIRSVLPYANDRRSTLTTMQNDADHLGVVGVMALGIAAALILALIGTLLSTWLNAASRLTNFAVTRALGMAPSQIAAMLLWEQGIIYGLALLLGIGLSAMLMLFVAPTTAALTIGHGHPWDGGAPNVPPIQTVIPYMQLLIMMGVLVVICLAALLLMARIVSRPSLSQTLRLNED